MDFAANVKGLHNGIKISKIDYPYLHQAVNSAEQTPDLENMSKSSYQYTDNANLLDIYDLDSVQTLPRDGMETFFDRYARGHWEEDTFHRSTPPIELMLEKTVSRKSTGENALRPRRPQTPATNDSGGMITPTSSHSGDSRDIHRAYYAAKHTNTDAASREQLANQTRRKDEPPNLTQSIETMYQNFLRESPSGRRYSDAFSVQDVGSNITAERGAEGYATMAAKRYAQLGYLEAPMPSKEAQRRLAVRSFKPFLHTLDPNLDRILRLAKQIFQADKTLLSLVDAHEVLYTFDGRDPYLVPRGATICSHTALLPDDQPLVVLDTIEDWRFKGNKAITEELQIRFYAGFPLKSSSGENVGAFCILGDKPRKSFGEEERRQLKEISLMVMRELESISERRQMALHSKMQRAVETFNRDAVTGSSTMEQLLSQAVDHMSHVLGVEGVVIFDAVNTSRRGLKDAEQQTWYDRTGNAVPIMVASERASHLAEQTNSSKQNSVLDSIFREHELGLLYTEDDILPENVAMLLPEGVTAAAVFPVSRSENKPFALICVYTLQHDYHFSLPESTLSFLNSMGLVLCSFQQKVTLSQADKAKVDFIANISHELRTPLHGILASCDLLAETVLSDTQESFLKTARQCATSLAETINHVLDFTKSTSGVAGPVASGSGEIKDRETRVPVNLVDLVEETMRSCWLGRTEILGFDRQTTNLTTPPEVDDNKRRGLHKGRVEPLIDIDPPIGRWSVLVDRAGLRRVLINLIGNSMKFTHEGYVRISLSCGLLDNDANILSVEIVVDDTGIGMSTGFIREKLFHPFSQERPLAQGIGLGLAIVRALLKSPGIDGTIDVQSVANKGTSMIVRFNAPVVENPDIWRTFFWPKSPTHSAMLKTISFAFIGLPGPNPGSKQLAMLLRRHLQRWYAELEEVDPSAANIVILDADYTAPDALKATLEDSAMQNQKKLVLASTPIDKFLLQISQASSGDGPRLALKPIGPHEIARLFSKMIGCSFPDTELSNRSDSLIASPTLLHIIYPSLPPPHLDSINPLSTPKPSLKTSSMENLLTSSRHITPVSRVLVVEDNPVNRKVLSAYLRKRGRQFAEAENGEEGVNIFEQYPAGHFDICLMDLQMPVMNGFEATATIRQIEKRRSNGGKPSPRMSIHALTGLASPEDKMRAANIGFDGYLIKPVSFKTLDEVFQSLPSRMPTA